MSWKGIALGGYIGGQFGGVLGALIGAFVGHKIEKSINKQNAAKSQRAGAASSGRGGGASGGRGSASGGRGGASGGHGGAPDNRSIVFCVSAAAMLAKMAKADGIVSRAEIESVEVAFSRLGFAAEARRCAVDAFRRAKNDSHSIYEYAREFAEAVDSTGVREVFYELLWDLACADGVVTPEELAILKRIPRELNIRAALFDHYASQRMRNSSGRESRFSRDPLAEAYATLGANAGETLDEIKRKYRELAKQNHPDMLRAKGLPEEMIGKATERMGRINAAWEEIKKSRG